MPKRSKDVNALLDLIEDSGCEVKRGGGFVAITGPDGAEFVAEPSKIGWQIRRTDEVQTERPSGLVPFPEHFHGRRLRNLVTELKQIGLVLELRHRAKAKRDPSPETPEEEPMTTPVKTAMEEIVEEILNPRNRTYVTDLVWHEMLMRARQDNAPQHPSGGKMFLHWTGRIEDVLKDGWSGFDEDDAPQMARIRAELPDTMRRTNDKAEMIHVYSDGRQVWSVRDDGRPSAEGDETEKPEPSATSPAKEDAKTLKGEIPPPAKSSSPAAKPKPKRRKVAESADLERCEFCAFSDFSKQSVTLHKTQARDTWGGVHPKEAYPCPKCPVVRVTPQGIQVHIRKRHGHGHLCLICAKDGNTVSWFKEAEQLNAHLLEHGEQEKAVTKVRARQVPAKKPSASAKEAAQKPEKPQTPEGPEKPAQVTEEPPAPTAPDKVPPAASGEVEHVSPALSGTVVAQPQLDEPSRKAIQMITEYPQLLAENKLLREQLTEERKKRIEAEGTLDGMRKMLGMPSGKDGTT